MTNQEIEAELKRISENNYRVIEYTIIPKSTPARIVNEVSPDVPRLVAALRKAFEFINDASVGRHDPPEHQEILALLRGGKA